MWERIKFWGGVIFILYVWLVDWLDLKSKIWKVPMAIGGMIFTVYLIDRFLSSKTVQKAAERKFWDLFD